MINDTRGVRCAFEQIFLKINSRVVIKSRTRSIFAKSATNSFKRSRFIRV
ncbi:MAG: hypothetical protein ACI915_002115 [Gammaproteobacteria bacterium]|jgi:hypothetical protein